MAKRKNPQQPENQVDNKHAELETQLKRALADYQNLERRVSEERQLLTQLTSVLVIEKFLPILDSLEAAQSHLNDQGLAIVIKQFNDVLHSEGVEQIEAKDQQFDPNLHEAAEVTEEGEDGKVVKVLAKGYKIRGRVIRPAKVVVSKKPESVQNQEGEVVASGSPDEPAAIID